MGWTLEPDFFFWLRSFGACRSRASRFAFGLVAASLWLYILSPVQTATLDRGVRADCAGLLGRKLRRADWHKLWPFVVGAAIGVPVGVTLLTWANPHSVRVGVGVFLVLYSLVCVFSPHAEAGYRRRRRGRCGRRISERYSRRHHRPCGHSGHDMVRSARLGPKMFSTEYSSRSPCPSS